MHRVKSIAIVACFALALGQTSARHMHFHPAEAGRASPIVHSHSIHLHIIPSCGTQIQKTEDDHNRVIYLTDFCLVTQGHFTFAALGSQALVLLPLKEVDRVSLIDQRAHDPPIFRPAHPRSPPA
jgi:hypothetical protein